jgi:L-alanine-DL-glutamate epimerase-like enolase superfamily enzyme
VQEALNQELWLGVDANQGFSRASLEILMPTLIASQVALIEQPFPIGQDALLDGFQSLISTAADENSQCASGI